MNNNNFIKQQFMIITLKKDKFKRLKRINKGLKYLNIAENIIKILDPL